MSSFATASRLGWVATLATLIFTLPAQALDLDWHGQFRAEDNIIYGYTNGVAAGSGYTVPNTGDSPSTFQNLFLRLTPRILVNDNVTLHSDIWLGLPDQTFFGSDGKTNRSYYSTTTGNANLTAHTLYAEIATDFGTLRAGRVPLNWGLGLVWNAKDDGTDRLPSSGDGFSLLTKFGAFQVMPAVIKYEDAGTQINGLNVPSNSGVGDYTLSIMYKNDDEQIDLGVMFDRRIAGNNSLLNNPFNITPAGTPNAAGINPKTTGAAFNIWDFYAQKKTGVFTISAEVPLVSGLIAGANYSAVSGAVKVNAQTSEHWNFNVDLGSASGQDNGNAGSPPSSFGAFSFHPDYRPGFILFNYNFYNIATGAGSIYNAPVSNAKFIALTGKYTTGKWSHALEGLYALASKTADGVPGNVYWNGRDGHYETQAGGAAQSSNLGVEFDYLMGYQWDESIRFGLDLGVYLPGKYYDFNDSATPNAHTTVFASNLNVLVKF